MHHVVAIVLLRAVHGDARSRRHLAARGCGRVRRAGGAYTLAALKDRTFPARARRSSAWATGSILGYTIDYTEFALPPRVDRSSRPASFGLVGAG